MCLQAPVIDKNDGSVGRVRWAHRLRHNDRTVGRGQGVDNVSKGLEIKTKAEGVRRRARGIYDNDRGAGGGR